MGLSLNEAALLFSMIGRQITGRNERAYPVTVEDAFKAIHGQNYNSVMIYCPNSASTERKKKLSVSQAVQTNFLSQLA